jgi:hypothetical protein
MKKLTLIALLFLSVNAFAQQKSNAQQFWDQLKKHCNKAYQGIVTDGMTDAFKNGPLVMHVRMCSDNTTIKIPFFVGDDKSRTWVLKLENDRILLKHDHRHQDGSEDKVTQYGGWSTNTGQAGFQIFPADEETAKLLPAAVGNVWWITIDDKHFTYNLRRIGTDRLFSVKFDLSESIKTPDAPWGWTKK